MMLMNSQVQKLYRLGHALGIDISIKRDDLLPMYMGGNKVRKNKYIFKELVEEKIPDIIMTNGGAESNHARVCALMAAEWGIDCHLVLHGEPDDSDYLHGNQFFIQSTGAVVDYVAPSCIAETLAKQKVEYEKKGLNVAVIPGGGHSVTGAKAYIDAVVELHEEPEYIVFASGTGATHAGIQAGVELRGWKTRVIGISIAREQLRGQQAVEEIYNELMGTYSDKTIEQYAGIEFNADYTQGGYGKYSRYSIQKLSWLVGKTGIAFDPVYSGKAMLGLINMIESGCIPRNAKVLFWHTGGLLNLQSAKKLSFFIE